MLKSKLSKIKFVTKLNESTIINYSEVDIKFFVSANIVSIIRKNDILTLSIYDKENGKIQYRLFLDKKEKEYITQDFCNDITPKWRQSTLQNLSFGWQSKSIIIDTNSARSILKYFKAEKNPLSIINDFQTNILKERLELKHKELTNEIDEKMKLVSKLPKNFKQWIEEEALYESRYIYYTYKRSNKPMTGYCTHCHNNVLVNKPKHNHKGICPSCKSPITYKSIGKSTRIEDSKRVAIIQKIPTGIVLRYFKVYKSYFDPYKPYLRLHECSRDFFEDTVSIYEWGNFKQTGQMRWCEGESHFNHFMGPQYDYSKICLYPKNLDNALKGTKWQYSEIKKYATQKNDFEMPIFKYLSYYLKYPFIEYLMKLNLTNLISNILFSGTYGNYYNLDNLFNINCKELHKILQLDKGYIPLLQRLNVNFNELSIIQRAYKNNIKITEELINYVEIHLKGDTDIFDLAGKYKLTINKIQKYISFQSKGNTNDEFFVFTTWRDYINNCANLNKLFDRNNNKDSIENHNQNLFNLTSEFVLFPKDLQKKHDETTNLLEDANVEQYNKIINSMYETIVKTYSFSWKNYMIVAPKKAQDITHEGQKLHHCVGTYIQDVATQKTTILFIREMKNPSKPFYTMEVKNGTVIQCRGRKNHSMTPEVENFLNQFKIKKLGYTKSA